MSNSTFETRLIARAHSVGIELPPGVPRALQTYYELLSKWNRTINLTALPLEGWPDETLDRLLLEPLAARPFVGEPVGDWIDFGSGGGSPAIPLAIVTPGARLTMTESRGRKAAFLREAVRALGLADVKVEGRFEDWPLYRSAQ